MRLRDNQQQTRHWQLVGVLAAVLLVAPIAAMPIYAQVSAQPQPRQTSGILQPDDANIQAVQTLSHSYGLESLYYESQHPPLSVNRDNFAFILLTILSNLDELIAAKTGNPVKPEDTALVQHLRATYGAELTHMRASMDYESAFFGLRTQRCSAKALASAADTPVGNFARAACPVVSGELLSPCFEPTFLQPDSVDVQALRSLIKKYGVILPSSKESPTPAILENRPIARHEFAAALDLVLTKAVWLRVNSRLVTSDAVIILQRLRDDYEIELTPEVLFGVHTKLYTYCLN